MDHACTAPYTINQEQPSVSGMNPNDVPVSIRRKRRREKERERGTIRFMKRECARYRRLLYHCFRAWSKAQQRMRTAEKEKDMKLNFLFLWNLRQISARARRDVRSFVKPPNARHNNKKTIVVTFFSFTQLLCSLSFPETSTRCQLVTSWSSLGALDGVLSIYSYQSLVASSWILLAQNLEACF